MFIKARLDEQSNIKLEYIRARYNVKYSDILKQGLFRFYELSKTYTVKLPQQRHIERGLYISKNNNDLLLRIAKEEERPINDIVVEAINLVYEEMESYKSYE